MIRVLFRDVLLMSVDQPALDLDLEIVGFIAIRYPAIGAKARHKRFRRGTARDYFEPSLIEGEFVRDLLTGSTEDVCNRWWGGVDAAARWVTK